MEDFAVNPPISKTSSEKEKHGQIRRNKSRRRKKKHRAPSDVSISSEIEELDQKVAALLLFESMQSAPSNCTGSVGGSSYASIESRDSLAKEEVTNDIMITNIAKMNEKHTTKLSTKSSPNSVIRRKKSIFQKQRKTKGDRSVTSKKSTSSRMSLSSRHRRKTHSEIEAEISRTIRRQQGEEVSDDDQSFMSSFTVDSILEDLTDQEDVISRRAPSVRSHRLRKPKPSTVKRNISEPIYAPGAVHGSPRRTRIVSADTTSICSSVTDFTEEAELFSAFTKNFPDTSWLEDRKEVLRTRNSVAHTLRKTTEAEAFSLSDKRSKKKIVGSISNNNKTGVDGKNTIEKLLCRSNQDQTKSTATCETVSEISSKIDTFSNTEIKSKDSIYGTSKATSSSLKGTDKSNLVEKVDEKRTETKKTSKSKSNLIHVEKANLHRTSTDLNQSNTPPRRTTMRTSSSPPNLNILGDTSDSSTDQGSPQKSRNGSVFKKLFRRNSPIRLLGKATHSSSSLDPSSSRTKSSFKTVGSKDAKAVYPSKVKTTRKSMHNATQNGMGTKTKECSSKISIERKSNAPITMRKSISKESSVVTTIEQTQKATIMSKNKAIENVSGNKEERLSKISDESRSMNKPAAIDKNFVSHPPNVVRAKFTIDDTSIVIPEECSPKRTEEAKTTNFTLNEDGTKSESISKSVFTHQNNFPIEEWTPFGETLLEKDGVDVFPQSWSAAVVEVTKDTVLTRHKGLESSSDHTGMNSTISPFPQIKDKEEKHTAGESLNISAFSDAFEFGQALKDKKSNGITSTMDSQHNDFMNRESPYTEMEHSTFSDPFAIEGSNRPNTSADTTASDVKPKQLSFKSTDSSVDNDCNLSNDRSDKEHTKLMRPMSGEQKTSSVSNPGAWDHNFSDWNNSTQSPDGLQVQQDTNQANEFEPFNASFSVFDEHEPQRNGDSHGESSSESCRLAEQPWDERGFNFVKGVSKSTASNISEWSEESPTSIACAPSIDVSKKFRGKGNVSSQQQTFPGRALNEETVQW